MISPLNPYANTLAPTGDSTNTQAKSEPPKPKDKIQELPPNHPRHQLGFYLGSAGAFLAAAGIRVLGQTLVYTKETDGFEDGWLMKPLETAAILISSEAVMAASGVLLGIGENGRGLGQARVDHASGKALNRKLGRHVGGGILLGLGIGLNLFSGAIVSGGGDNLKCSHTCENALWESLWVTGGGMILTGSALVGYALGYKKGMKATSQLTLMPTATPNFRGLALSGRF